MKNFICFMLLIPIIGWGQIIPGNGGPPGGGPWILASECGVHTGTYIYLQVSGHGPTAQVSLHFTQTTLNDCFHVTSVSVTGPTGNNYLGGPSIYNTTVQFTGCGLYTIDIVYGNSHCDCQTTIMVPCGPEPCGIEIGCDDGLDCTVNDVRTVDQSGVECIPCQGEPTDCEQGSLVSCDDGDPCTDNDVQLVSPCNGSICVPCHGTAITDTDGDGICDEDDCDANDASVAHSPGDHCDDGDPSTVNDVYDANCICVGEPNDCNVDPDDGCPLTIDILNDDCTVTNIPPDPDDGCPYTSDYFDAARCEIINLPLPCDDGDPNTIEDEYQENCECKGYDPCELDGVDWDTILNLLNGN